MWNGVIITKLETLNTLIAFVSQTKLSKGALSGLR